MIKLKVAFYTLGCKVNQYETEAVMMLFKEKGYDVVEFEEKADVYVINTCTVTNAGDAKGRKVIRNARDRNKDAVIAVMGCYSQAKPEEVARIDGVHIVIGNNNKTKIVDLVEEYLMTEEPIKEIANLKETTFESMSVTCFSSRTRAFVKIQDGCNNFCSYCIIPYVRGVIRSKPMDAIVEEVNALVKNGYVEIVLTGIHIGNYGKDLGNIELSDLLERLLQIQLLKRIRISSIEVVEINQRMLEMLKNTNLIADHLHIPLQSGSDYILKQMNRRYDSHYFRDKIEQIRKNRPDISITTDVIVGFPGETDEYFLETVQFIKKIGFSELHVFPYSPRSGTKAALMSEQIDGKEKKERVNQLLALSKELEKDYMKKFVNQSLDVIFEKNQGNNAVGHASNYLKVMVENAKALEGKNMLVQVIEVKYPYCISKIE